MTTTLRQSFARLPAVRTTAARVGRVPYLLSVVLALVAGAAAVGAIVYPDLIRAPAVTVGNMRGTAIVLGVVILPILVAAMTLQARGIVLAVIFWFGALGSVAYQSVLFLFGVPFNAFFFLNVAMLGLSVWALILLGSHVSADLVALRIGPKAPRRLVAGYLLVNALLFALLWLRSTLPPVLSGELPAFLEGTGMLTGPVQILDFAFTLPLMVVAAVVLLRGRAWGYLLSGALLVMLTIETASIGVDQWMGPLPTRRRRLHRLTSCPRSRC